MQTATVEVVEDGWVASCRAVATLVVLLGSFVGIALYVGGIA